MHYEDAGVKLDVSRLRDGRGHSPTAWFSIKAGNFAHDNNKSAPRPFKTAFKQDLASTRARDDSVRYLSKIDGAILPPDGWRSVIEWACYLPLQKHRESTREVSIMNHKITPASAKWRLEPFLEDGESTLIFGPGDSGKSFLALYMAYLVATGKEHLGLKPVQGRVLYLDWEATLDVTARRLEMLAKGFGGSRPDGFWYMRMADNFMADFDRVHEAVRERDISLVVVDSAALATSEPESSQVVSEFFGAVREMATATLIVAHVAKTGKEHEPFGSVFWTNLARNTYRASASRPNDDLLSVRLRNHKANNQNRLRDRAFDLTFTDLAFTDEAVTVTRGDPGAVLDDEPETNGERIYQTLLRGQLSTNDLAERLELSPGVVRKVLSEMKAGGRVKRLEDHRNGKWGILRTPRT